MHRGCFWLIAVLLVSSLFAGCSNKEKSGATSLQSGFQKLRTKDVKGAESDFKQHVENSSSPVLALAPICAAYIETKEGRAGYEFLKQYEAKIEKMNDLDKGEYYRMLGDLAMAVKPHEVEKAIEAYDKAIKADERNPLILNNYAFALAEADRNLEKAYDMANRAVAINSAEGAFRDTLGWVYYKRGDYQNAVKELKMAVDTSVDNADLRYHLAAAYAKTGKIQDAKVELEKALALDKNHAESQALHAELQGK